MRFAVALFALLLLAVPASARLGHLVGGAAPSVSQTIASVSPSTASFNQGTSAGTSFQALTATMSPASPSFTAGGGTVTLSTSLDICNGTNGANNNLVQVSALNLQVSSAGQAASAGTYAVCVAFQTSAASNSPKGLAITLTISSVTQTITGISPTTGSYTSGVSSGTVVFGVGVSMMPSTPNFSGTLALSGTAAADFSLSSTTLPSNLTTNGSTPTCSSTTNLNLNIVATQAGATGSPFTQAITVTCNPAGTLIGSATIINDAGSTTPSGAAQTCLSSGITCFPKRLGYGFAEGAVPTGMIAVPMIGGSTAIRYQCDLATFWPDGSLKHCSFKIFAPALAPGATEQVTFTAQTGSYDHTSSGTVSDITGGSDYKVELANESQIGRTNNANVSTSLTAATWSGGVASFTEQNATFLTTGDGVTVAGMTSPGFSITGSVSHATLTTSANLSAGQIITGTGGAYVVSGSAPTYTLSADLGTIPSFSGTVDYNGHFVVTVVDSTHFTVAMASNPGTQSGLGFISFGMLPIGVQVGFVVSGGSVVSGTINHGQGAFSDTCFVDGGSLCNPANITQATYGCTVKPNASVNYDPATGHAISVTVHSGGSGCAVDGSGSYTCGFNDIETNSPGTVVQIEKGQLVDTWAAWGPCYDNTGGAAHTRYYIRVIVERWKDAVGGTYAFRAVGLPTSGIYVPGGVMPSIMADACWQNGSTQIRGFCPGGSGPTADTNYEGINNTVQGGWRTLQTSAKPDWSVNGAGLDAVELAYTTTDEGFLKGTKLVGPWDDTARAAAAGNYGSTISFTGTQNQSFDQCQYYPMNYGCTDSDADWGNAGSHRFTSAAGSTGDVMCYLMMAYSGSSDHGRSWCTQSRIAMASIAAIDSTFEPATGYPVNIISTSTYPSLTPLRASATSYMNFLDMTDPQGIASQQAADNNPGTAFDGVSNIQNKIDWGHVPSSEMILPFVLEAEPWMYYAIDGLASVAILEGLTDSRNVTFSGTYNTVFTGLTFNSTGNGIRQATWSTEAVSIAANFLPTSFPEQAYYEYLMQQNYTFARQEVEQVGTMTDGDGTVTKAHSLASVGVTNSLADFLNLDTPLSQFMQGYFSGFTSINKSWWAGKYADLDQLWNYQTKTYLVHVTGQSCPYDSINYVNQFWNNDLFNYSAAADTTSSDSTNPTVPNFDKRGATNNINTTSGSSVLTGEGAAINIDYPSGSGMAMPALSRIIPSIVNADSECIELTESFTPNSDCGASPTGTWPPPANIGGTSNGTFQNTWYYYYPLDVQHGVISTDATGVTGTMSISGTSLTGPSGLAVGNYIGGVGVTGGTKITAGTSSPYAVNNSQTVSSETMVADTNMLVFTQSTLGTWGWVPSICGTNVMGYADANWESFGGQSGGDNRWSEFFGMAKLAKAAGGDFADADSTIANYTANGGAGYPNTIDPQYLYGQSYVGGGN